MHLGNWPATAAPEAYAGQIARDSQHPVSGIITGDSQSVVVLRRSHFPLLRTQRWMPSIMDEDSFLQLLHLS